ncbi:MAG: AMP-binding protein [Desulfuromonadales bacterium]|nr:AMP-binding protein [Desulfuromonadales bacterium]
MQDDRLRSHLAYLLERSPFYRRRWAELGLAPGTVQGVADLPLLPTTSKADLERAAGEFLCVPETETVDLCLTSGTTGEPLVLLQTRHDLERLARNEEITFRRLGLGPADRVLLAVALDRCFMAGLAYFLGLVRLGATALRGGSGSLPHLAELVRRQRPTVIIAVPSLLLALAERLQADGIDPRQTGVRTLVGIGEPVRASDLRLSPLGARVQERWGGAVFGTYASTEMATAFSDCTAGAGGHLHPELAAVEIVDAAGKPLPPGEAGEVTVTPLGVTGMPLLRFRTGDIAVLHTEPCICGRRSPRLGPILGRQAQMLKIRGTTVFPPAVFALLQELDGACGWFLEAFDDYALSDRLRVTVAVRDRSLTAEMVAERLAARLRVKPEVVIAPAAAVTAKTVQEGKRKPVLFFDYRQART